MPQRHLAPPRCQDLRSPCKNIWNGDRRMVTRKRLGNSTLDLTPIGLGSWAIGGAWRFGWGPQDDSDSIATIRRAVDRGINWIDTAPVYGLGRSEQVVGRALSDIPRG